jgi:hypothetical protein
LSTSRLITHCVTPEKGDLVTQILAIDVGNQIDL